MMQKKFGSNLTRHEHECFKLHMQFINQRIMNALYGEILLMEHILIRVRKLSILL